MTPNRSRTAPGKYMPVQALVLSCLLLAMVVAVSSAFAGGNDTSFTVTSSLDGKTVVPLRSHWIAYPQIDPAQGQVTEVDYLIDGFHAWTAHNSPWYFGDQGNWLVTTVLKPGLHTFTVRAVVSPDKVAIDKLQARVVAPPRPPAGLAGSWTRAGRTLFIGKTGWGIGSNQFFDAHYVANGNVILGPEIIDRPEQPATCGPNPPTTWKVVPGGGKRMQLRPIGTDRCATRLAALRGTWTRH